MRNIRALSEVIGIVLMVVVGLSLAATASVLINSIIKQASLSPEVSCLDMQIKNALSIEKACYNQISKDAEITIKASNIEIKDLNFIITKKESKTFSCTNCNNCVILKNGETKTYYFQYMDMPEKIAIIANGCFIEEKNIANC